MKLSKLKLWNYRCFGSEEQVILIDQLTTFIGNNSAGKTAALSALNCMFSENSNDRILHRSDFHLPKDILPDEMEQQSLYIEAVFEFEELQSGSNGGEYAIPIFFQHFVVDNPGRLPYLRIRLEATWEKSNTIDGSIDSKISYITCPEFAEIEEGNRTNASRRDLDKIRVIYVPAVRDPSKQLKNASGTMMYQIMSSINWSEETKGNVKAKIKELNEQFEEEKGVSMFGTSLGKQWKTYFMNVINQFESLFFEEYVAAHGVWNLAIENFRGDHSVPIMTIHKSKGLEYNAVYFIGLEDSAFWNFRNQPDEDRCTFFVALSRAKASVTFTFCKKRTGMKCPMQRHNAINEFFDLLQRPGIAEVKRFQNR